MKNNKMFLALVVVAALAMVSVAGVAVLSDNQSDAAEPTYINGSANVTLGTVQGDVFIYNTTSGINITINDSVSYSGIITVGTRTGDGTTADPYVYTASSSVTLSDASDLVITVNSAKELVLNGTYTGSITLTLGTVTMGSSSEYTGTVISSGLTVATNNVTGVAVTYGTTSIISGDIVKGPTPDDWGSIEESGYIGTVTLSGTGSIGTTIVGEYVEMIIANGATITSEVSTQTYTNEADISVAFNSSVSNVYDAAIDGVSGTYNASTHILTFSGVTVNPTGSATYFTLFSYIASGVVYDYSGDLVIESTDTVGSYTVEFTDDVPVVSTIDVSTHTTIDGLDTSVAIGTLTVVATTDAGEIGAIGGTILTFPTGSTSIYASCDGTLATVSGTTATFSATLTDGAIISVSFTADSTNYYIYGTIMVDDGRISGIYVEDLTEYDAVDGVVIAPAVNEISAVDSALILTVNDLDSFNYAVNVTTGEIADVSGTTATFTTALADSDLIFATFVYENNSYYFYGTVGVTTNVTAFESIVMTSSSFANSFDNPAAGEIGALGTNDTTIVCNSADQILYAYNVTTNAVATITTNTAIFTSITNGDTIFVLLMSGGSYLYYNGAVTVTGGVIAGLEESDIITPADVVETPSTGEIGYDATTNNTLLIADTFMCAYTSADATVVSTSTDGSIVFSSLTDGDTVLVLFNDGTSVYAYYGDVSILTSHMPEADEIGFSGFTNTISYGSDYTVVYSIDVDNSAVGAVDTINDTIRFSGIQDGDVVYILFVDGNGDYFAYYGEVTMDYGYITGLAVTDEVTEAESITTGTPSVNQIKVTTPVTAIPADTITEIEIELNAKLTVIGTFSALYKSATIYSEIYNNGIIDVTGTLIYQNNTPLTYTNSDEGITAVSYKVAGTSSAPDTYTYTTLVNAMKNGSELTVYGILSITEDTTLTGNGSTNSVDVSANSKIIIGSSEVYGDEENATAVVTVPTTTTLTITSAISSSVVNGKLVFESKTSYIGDAKIYSAVSMEEGSNFIYTDLQTAFGLAVAGDTITLRSSGYLTSTITLDADVTLATGSNYLRVLVYYGVTLTIDGKVTGNGIFSIAPAVAATASDPAKTVGTVIINSQKISSSVGFAVYGVLTFASTFDNTGDDDTAFACSILTDATSSSVPTINVNGKVYMTGTINDSYSTLTASSNVNVSGILITANTAGVFSEDNIINMIITGTFTANESEVVYSMTVTGTGVVSSVTGKTITVSDLTIGTAATSATETVNGATVKVVLDGIAVIYGTYDETKIILTDGDYSTVFYLETTIVYKTVVSNSESISDKTTYLQLPVLTGLVFNGWYDAPTSGERITSSSMTVKINDPAEIYGYTEISTTSMTFSAVQNGTWYVNGNQVSGTATVAYAASYNIQFLANNGYELNDVSILVNNKAMPAGYTPTNGDVLTISGSVDEKSVGDSGLSVTEILLIVMVIIIAIIAVVVILKLMRS